MSSPSPTQVPAPAAPPTSEAPPASSPRGAGMLAAVARLWKLFPVTAILVVVAVGLFIATRVHWKTTDDSLDTTLRLYGSVVLRELWQGDFWRLLVSGFHHGFLFHLVGNLIVLAWLGRLAEFRLPRWWYLAFCLSATVLTILVEALLDQEAIGLSGLVYALFGLLLVMRRHDPLIAWYVPPSLIVLGIGSLLAGIPIAMAGWVPIANSAHFAGLLYGLLVGAGLLWQRQRLVLALHLLIIPALWCVAHPWWNVRYNVYRGEQAATVDQQIAWFRRALDRAPDDLEARIRLTAALVEKEQTQEAWREVLIGIRTGGPESALEILDRQACWIWISLGSADARLAADTITDEVLGDAAEPLKTRLNLDWLSVLAAARDALDGVMPAADDTSDDLQIPGRTASPSEAFDPDDPDSAAAGRRT